MRDIGQNYGPLCGSLGQLPADYKPLGGHSGLLHRTGALITAGADCLFLAVQLHREACRTQHESQLPAGGGNQIRAANH